MLYKVQPKKGKLKEKSPKGQPGVRALFAFRTKRKFHQHIYFLYEKSVTSRRKCPECHFHHGVAIQKAIEEIYIIYTRLHA